MSVPRLELSAAQLLARLMQFVRTSLDFKTVPIHCWTDSTITLAWLNRPSSHWKTFVANRVAEIHTLLPDAAWRHVTSQDNPADSASRSISPADLDSNILWWSGPAWLTGTSVQWPSVGSQLDPESLLEERASSSVHTTAIIEPWDLSQRYSSWKRLLRITAYVYRFVENIRSRLQVRMASVQGVTRSQLISPTEIENAEHFWLRSIQAEMFPSEKEHLSNNVPVPKSSPLLPLNPFLDSQKVIRVGGRLRNANIPDSSRHPIILKDHPLVRMIIRDIHARAIHGGPQLTLALLREKFWILRARSLVRAVLYQCVTCTRERAQVPTELMGDLPSVRVTRATRAFQHTGVDYAGPVLVRTTRGRGHKAHKAYIAVLICMTTKAIHLELVSDYSTSAFLAAFQRFVSRRGFPASMYSDNGTTFQGADRELRTAAKSASAEPNFLSRIASEGTTWHFIPPSAPHFGGLWEAAVRSVKYHLKRCIGSYTLTFEELSTVLCRIEACLNSCPITSMSQNLDDYSILTPGHFLTGGPILAAPEPSVLEVAESRLSRWQLLQRITENFWKAWSNDYILTLQQRPKWRTVQRLAQVGRIVLLRNPFAPPCQWELGRITECHRGDDGLTRVVTIRTARSQYTRPIVKLCFLPIDINNEAEILSAMAGGANNETSENSSTSL
ncbi:PREDICTED: uncharacterized protein LOC105462593 [Wasmannia auropunctata]|uniref:uncharacterized protein LOC105462593 n=1 Tax=Wasmannia auropunctata TaxID=64793 RepID=UPI0005EEE529|nr:PREDICTED: uncharacterized protein LOC105462593 [Wasmannia auropunctata]